MYEHDAAANGTSLFAQWRDKHMAVKETVMAHGPDSPEANAARKSACNVFEALVRETRERNGANDDKLDDRQ